LNNWTACFHDFDALLFSRFIADWSIKNMNSGVTP
jgi:hypothetical protein